MDHFYLGVHIDYTKVGPLVSLRRAEGVPPLHLNRFVPLPRKRPLCTLGLTHESGTLTTLVRMLLNSVYGVRQEQGNPKVSTNYTDVLADIRLVWGRTAEEIIKSSRF